MERRRPEASTRPAFPPPPREEPIRTAYAGDGQPGGPTGRGARGRDSPDVAAGGRGRGRLSERAAPRDSATGECRGRPWRPGPTALPHTPPPHTPRPAHPAEPLPEARWGRGRGTAAPCADRASLWGRGGGVGPLPCGLTGRRYGAGVSVPLSRGVTGRRYGAGVGGSVPLPCGVTGCCYEAGGVSPPVPWGDRASLWGRECQSPYSVG